MEGFTAAPQRLLWPDVLRVCAITLVIAAQVPAYGFAEPLCLAHAENLLHWNIAQKFGLRKRLRPWNHITGSSLLFYWGNEELKKIYARALAAAPRSIPADAKVSV